MNNNDKVRFEFKVDFTNCDASDTMKDMLIATIKHDIYVVLDNHKEIVNGITYSEIVTGGVD